MVAQTSLQGSSSGSLQQSAGGDELFTRKRAEPLSDRLLDGLERELSTNPDTVLVEASQLRVLLRATRRVRLLEAEAEIQEWRIKLEAQELALQLLRDL